MPDSGMLSAVLTITTLVATGLAGLMIGSLRTLRDNNNDLTNRVGLVEGKVIDRDAEIALLKADRDALARVVVGEADRAALMDLLVDHHHQAMLQWAETKDILDVIASQGDTP